MPVQAAPRPHPLLCAELQTSPYIHLATSPPASAGGPFAVFFLAVPWLAIGAQARGRDREKRCTRHRAHLCLSLVHAHVDASRGDTQSEEA